MALALLTPVAFLLFLLAMERVEARLFPAAPTADLGKGDVGHPVDHSSDDDLATPLGIAAPPVAGAVLMPANAQ